MTQTMRDKLQALAVKWKKKWELLASHGEYVEALAYQNRLREINEILATEPPAVTVRAGWVCKDEAGLWWYSDQPFWVERYQWWDYGGAMHQLFNGAVTDPWPDKPNGGPDCVMEVG